MQISGYYEIHIAFI